MRRAACQRHRIQCGFLALATQRAMHRAILQRRRLRCSVLALAAQRSITRCHLVFLAPHTSGPRDVPRCGALSLLRTALNYRGDPAKTAAGLTAKLWTYVGGD
jgi:hypothetical protein